MVEVRKCLDTYALVEIAKGNPKYAGYLTSTFVITDLTLAEFYAVLLREEGEKVADYWFRKLERFSLPVNKEMLIEAIRFRYEHRKQEISIVDAAGYIFSLKQGYLFVTGDEDFASLANVEFRKK